LDSVRPSSTDSAVPVTATGIAPTSAISTGLVIDLPMAMDGRAPPSALAAIQEGDDASRLRK
jgi:hypothetical protein